MDDIAGSKGRIVPVEFTAEAIENAPDDKTQWAAHVEGAKAAIHGRARADIPTIGTYPDGQTHFILRGHPILEHQFKTAYDEVEPQVRDKDHNRYLAIKDLSQRFGLKGY